MALFSQHRTDSNGLPRKISPVPNSCTEGGTTRVCSSDAKRNASLWMVVTVPGRVSLSRPEYRKAAMPISSRPSGS